MHKHRIGVILVLIAMYILATIHVICRWILVRNSFVDHGDTSATSTLYLTQPPLWLTVLAAVVFSVNTLVADCVLIWRCWTIWGRNWLVVGLPIACTIAGAGLGFKSIAEQAAFIENPKLDRSTFIDFATPYFSLSLVTTCLATILIVGRIVSMTENGTRTFRGYTRVIEVIVESALLYSVAMAIFLPLLVRNSVKDGYAQAVVGQITGIAPTLIVARVTFGYARPDQTWQIPTSSIFMRSAPEKSTITSIPMSRVNDVGSSINTDAMKLERWEN
ncbi:hypothetical protein B0H19DRAFT_377302 [Mycena capillaripes]|nr:hypothetical protein B0H19DRAFT_377302 [Mycena capillaripes]